MPIRDFTDRQMKRAELGLDGWVDISVAGTDNVDLQSDVNKAVFCILPQVSGETVVLDSTSILEESGAALGADLGGITIDNPLFGLFSYVKLDATSNPARCYFIRGAKK